MILTHPSYDNVSQAIRHILLQLDQEDFRPDIVAGLARGGLVPAVIVSQALGIPMQAVHYSSKRGKGNDKNHDNQMPSFSDYSRVLLIDDICDSGHTLNEIDSHLRTQYDPELFTHTTATLYAKDGAVFLPNIYWHQLPPDAPFIVFPWERNVKYLNL